MKLKIGAGKYMNIHTGSGSNTASDRRQGRRADVWNNTSNTATLTRSNDSKVDTCSWTTRNGSDKYC
ncbi:hypothetical protein [Streptomyces sp. NRRL F-2799]|uniref:hypothetical protein n=1 Tax=Streptomyces sp. NRRL F-2799 TaxID=1463844 RepID=UPI000A414A0E|nr:hypothetical protein [Streptomyces sp. NRRL F-2799]